MSYSRPVKNLATLDAGYLASMQGWKYKVANGLGQTVVIETANSRQHSNISLGTWGGNGIYYLYVPYQPAGPRGGNKEDCAGPVGFPEYLQPYLHLKSENHLLATTGTAASCSM